uniref:Phosphatidylserine decarboxylase n=1 Tax=Aplanochytrium stocchinoi TaxID=215587 RepID=A0A7S3LNU2_9STRA
MLVDFFRYGLASVVSFLVVDIGASLIYRRLHSVVAVVERYQYNNHNDYEENVGKNSSIHCKSDVPPHGEVVKENTPFMNQVQIFLAFETFCGRKILCNLSFFRQYLINESIAKGTKYDSPNSKREILNFISDFSIDTNTICKPVDEFSSLNDFFYRKLPKGLRPIAFKDDLRVATVPCDCRISVYSNVEQARRCLIKGENFTLERFVHLSSNQAGLKSKFTWESAIAVCRLAPNDYHRFHSPLACAVDIQGQYEVFGEDLFTVKSRVLRGGLDVFTRNRRICVPLQSTNGYVA